MAKLKADWLKEAQDLGLDVTSKNTVAEIKAAINEHESQSKDNDEIVGEVAPEDIVTEDKSEDDEDFTKAGRRSKKGVEEAEEKAEKIARQKGELDEADTDEDEDSGKKGPKPKVRPLIERRSKRYRAAAEKVNNDKDYNLPEAVALAQQSSTVKFDASVELHMRLNIDTTQADQNIRGSITLPHGTGRETIIAVLAEDDKLKAAKAAGADYADTDELMDKLENNDIDFDMIIAQPSQMSKLGKYAKNLGPQGLMPNPKSGTVTDDIAKTVKEMKAGRVEYRADKHGNIHMGMGKVSFETKQLEENAQALIKALEDARPRSVKGEYVASSHLTTSMGPSISFGYQIEK